MQKIFDLIRETWRGKSIGRILSNWAIGRHCKNLKGVMIDLGGGERPSYERYWGIAPSKFIRADIDPGKHPDVVADLNKPLPFADNFADHVFLFNTIYIMKEPRRLMTGIYRVLKPGGALWVLSPFMFPEAKEPDDFFRYTSEGLEADLRNAGFASTVIESVGERWSVAVSLLAPFLPFRVLRIPFFCIAVLLDRLTPRGLKKEHPAPLAYFCKVVK